jgi:dTDP-4-dehydrorhamnose reductase
MKILVIGRTGQVGWEAERSLQCLGEAAGAARADVDLADLKALAGYLDTHGADVVVNASAYTAVDAAERDEAAARCLNVDVPRAIAEWAARRGAFVVHYSTDYVFDGTQGRPWTESDPTGPLSVYARTKLAGEQAVVASGCEAVILRTSWVYAARGKNFLTTILRLAAERETLRVVADQVGAPTAARLIADVTARIVAARCAGAAATGARVLHLAAAGATSWHGFACEVVAQARRRGMPLKVANIVPITTSQYPTPARRPLNSRLDCTALQRDFGLRLPPWQDGVRLCVEEIV